ncbi:MAG: DUF3501 family protein [Pseudomonadales bacterium]|nr:DUF3501 family protein [Pseudomonadales bacterium]
MPQLTRQDLWSLESYSDKRNDFRRKVMAHKKNRRVSIGEHCRLYFEDQLTIQYQIQEMLRIEKIFEAKGIQEELDAYNPLIPTGSNLKATFMIEYDDPEERQRALEQLIGIETKIAINVEDFDPVYPFADEDLERENDHKTSAVHFLRFEFPDAVKSAILNGSDIKIGLDHPHYQVTPYALNQQVRDTLAKDLKS